MVMGPHKRDFCFFINEVCVSVSLYQKRRCLPFFVRCFPIGRFMNDVDRFLMLCESCV